MTKCNIELVCFGSFREVDSVIQIELSIKSTVHQLKNALSNKLGSQYGDLVKSSAIADNTSILEDDYIIGQSMSLSLLPPVCGG